MILIIKILFFLFLFLIFYVYIGYPVFIAFLSLFLNKKVKKAPFEPFVTILIAAYNEESCIENTIRNNLSLDYPSDKLEIIVISDESNDKTDEIVKQFEPQGVKLLRQVPRAGKTSALNMAVPEATGEILVFSDANSTYAPDVLCKLAMNFADPGVGYVTGKMIYTNPAGSTIGGGCSAYMKYENFLRKFETGVGSVVGVDGGVDAVRKKLYQPMNPDQLPDFVLPLKVVEQGYRVVYESEAILKEAALKESRDEYKMRVRVSLRALWALSDMRNLLTFRFGNACSHLRPFSPSFIFSWQLWSHKVLRYLCFIFLIGAYFTNWALWPESGLYRFIFILQNISYAGAILSPVFEKKKHRSPLLYFLNYFVLLNVASAHAFIKFVLRRKQVVWTPRKG
jgi:cellulose synthase/poly-beta-1,6-N-acetylglucosamine synthase-like glycosyltransferase